MSAPPEPVFAEPWHAQLFALTVHLNETGRLAWPFWAERFAATLKRHGLSRELDGGDDYFMAWLETLEQILVEDGSATQAERSRALDAWRQAYLETPHGQPVTIGG